MSSYLESLKKQFLYYKKLGEQAMEQVKDQDLFWQYNEESNSIAFIVQHISGNMLSRFTDFRTTDGEKAWRNRDAEFADNLADRTAVMDCWNKGWDCLLQTLDTIMEKDLEEIIYIRNEGHTICEAFNRQLAHYPYHIGQIVFIAKMAKDQEWQTLSIARNRSEDYNSKKFSAEKTRRHFTDNA